MKRRHAAALGLVLLIPIGLALALGLAAVREDREKSRLRAAELLSARLDDLAARLRESSSRWEERLRRDLAATGPEPAALRGLSMNHAWIRQAFSLDPKGRLAYPKRSEASLQEAAFFERCSSFLDAGWLPRSSGEKQEAADYGWKSWYWREGQQWIFWLRLAGAGFLAAELNRSALLADLAGGLPGPSIPAERAGMHRVSLRDDRQALLAQWGVWDPPQGSLPLARRGLSGPLEGWELVYELHPALWSEQAGAGTAALALGGLGLVLLAVALAVYLVRGVDREMRLAGQRISFVNQVSHELKTPLTNIRLYAELLESRLAGSDESARDYLGVIQREGRRLSRLIHNVLSFSRRGKNDAPNPRPGRLDDTVRQTAETFAVSLAEKGMKLELDLRAPEEVLFDPDLLDQALGNLLSNAEKYARAGGWVRVETRQSGRLGEVRVIDRGPGIPAAARRRLFQPFERFHTALTDAVGGTGLGLYLSRELARRHGGDLVLEEAGTGCSFLLSLAAPPAARGDAT